MTILLYRLGGVPTVTLLVGEEKLPFYVHLDLICNESSVFKAAFSGEFIEASKKSMDLPDHDIESVERMIQWLYTKNYELAKWSSESIKTTASKRFWQLAKLNTLADKYNIIDQLYVLHSKHVPPQLPVAIYVYENTTENSSFRKLLTAWFVWDIDMNWYHDPNIQESLLDIPEFAVDLGVAFGRKACFPAPQNPFQCDKSTHYCRPEEAPTSHAE